MMGERQTRSDKKRDVRPTIAIDLKDAIYRLSYITHTPVKDVCEQLCIYVINDLRVINGLTQFFKRDIRLGNTMYFGRITNKAISKKIKGERERVTVRFTQPIYESISVLSYALDCSVSRVVAILLDIAMHNMEFVNKYVKVYLDGQLNESQMRELQGVLKYVNVANDKHHTWASLLGLIVDEVSAPVTRIKDAVSEFLGTIKDK